MEETGPFKQIISLLESKKVPYEKLEHDYVHSSQDAAKVRGTKIEEAAKALVLKTGSGKIILCVVSGHRRLDLKRIKQLLKEKNVSLAHPDDVLEATGCPVGSVPPFGNLFEPALTTYADQDIFSRDHVCFSAGSHYHSIRMRAMDWAELVKAEVADIGKEA